MIDDGIYEMSAGLKGLFESRKIGDDGKGKVNNARLTSLEVGKSYFVSNAECSHPTDLEKALANYRSLCSRYSKNEKKFGVMRHETGFEIGRYS